MSEEVKEVVEEVKKLNVWQKLSKIQLELKAPKTQYNKFGKYYYRNCEDIFEGLKPLFEKYQATVIFEDTTDVKEGWHYIESTAVFVDTETGQVIKGPNGHAREDEVKKGMDASQITGSATSYARKYALNSLFLIDDTKDSDATNDGSQATTQAKKSTGQPSKVTNQHLNKLFELAIRKGVDQSTVRKQISKAFNKTAEEMTLTEYERVVAGYEKMKEKE